LPILLAILGLLAAASFWMYRIHHAANAANALLNAAQDVRSAARRFGYRLRNNQHPVEGIDDPRVSATALLVLVAKTEDGVSKASQAEIEDQLQTVFQMRRSEAQEMYFFAKWLAGQSQNPSDMTRRLIKRTLTLGGRDTLPDLITMVRAVGEADTGTASIDTLHVIEKIKQLNV